MNKIQRIIAGTAVTGMAVLGLSTPAFAATYDSPPRAVRVGQRCEGSHTDTVGHLKTVNYTLTGDTGLYCYYRKTVKQPGVIPFTSKTTVTSYTVAKIQKNCGSPYIQVC